VCVNSVVTKPLCRKRAHRTVVQQWTIPAFRLSDTLVVMQTCINSAATVR
jgi:hypothetical protein